MSTIKIQLFPQAGAVNNVLNNFAEFILNRKSLSESTEKKFVRKLQSLQGATNSPVSLLQQRIDNNEINYKQIACSRDIINEMKSAIQKHSN